MLKRLNEIEKMEDTDKGHIFSDSDGFIKSIKLKKYCCSIKIKSPVFTGLVNC